MWNFRSHVRGKYRFRISGYGFQSEGKPVSFRVTAGTLKEVTEERLVDYFAVPADQPTVIEFTEQLEPENRFAFWRKACLRCLRQSRKSARTSIPVWLGDSVG